MTAQPNPVPEAPDPDGIPPGVNVEIQLVMTERTLLDGDEEPAILTGYGPIPAALARRLIRGADPRTTTWVRRLFTDPVTGHLSTADTRRRIFTPTARHYLIARDQYCRTPYCGAPIRHADHTTPHARGRAHQHQQRARLMRELQLHQTSPRLEPPSHRRRRRHPHHHPHRAHHPQRPTTTTPINTLGNGERTRRQRPRTPAEQLRSKRLMAGRLLALASLNRTPLPPLPHPVPAGRYHEDLACIETVSSMGRLPGAGRVCNDSADRPTAGHQFFDRWCSAWLPCVTCVARVPGLA